MRSLPTPHLPAGNGTFRQHGPKRNQCLGTYRTPESAATLILPPLTDDQLDLMWSACAIGDWRPIELEFGSYSRSTSYAGRRQTTKLAHLIHMVRVGITSLVDVCRDPRR